MSQMNMLREQLHKKYPPTRQRPFFFTKIQWSSTFNEEGNEYLHAFNEFLDCEIRQLAAPYLKFSIATGIALDEISRWLEVFSRRVLKIRVKMGSAAKGGCKLIRLVFWQNESEETVSSYMKVSSPLTFPRYQWLWCRRHPRTVCRR